MEGDESTHKTSGANMSAARALRLNRVRESSINPSALHDRRCRSVYDLTHIDRHASAMSFLAHTERQFKPGTPESTTMRSSRKEEQSMKSPAKSATGESNGGNDGATVGGNNSVTTDLTDAQKRRRQKDLSFGDQVDKCLKDHGSMEYVVWKHKQHAPRDAAQRMVVRPDLQKFYMSMIPSQRQLLQDKMAAKVERLTKDIRQRHERMKEGMDSNNVFHPNANAQRVHTLQLTELQRRLDIQKIEDETLEDMFNMQTDESIKDEEKSVVASILKGTPFNAFGMTGSSNSRSSKIKSNEEQLMGLSRTSHTASLSAGKSAKASAAASLMGRKLLGGTPPLVLSKRDRDKHDNPMSPEARAIEAKTWSTAPEIHDGDGKEGRFVADFETFQNSGVGAGSVPARAKVAGNTTLIKQLANDEPGFKDYMRVHLVNHKDGKQKQFSGPSNSSKRGLPPLPKTPAVQMMLSQKVSGGERPPVGEFIHSRGSEGGSLVHRTGLAFENIFLSSTNGDTSSWDDNQQTTDPTGEENGGLKLSEEQDLRSKEQSAHFADGFDSAMSESFPQEKLEGVKVTNALQVSRNHNSESNSTTTGLESLHPRLQHIWFTLEYSMQAKLEFLQKYAETSAAQVLPEVVTLLERLAFIIPHRELLLDLKQRNAGGEMLDLDTLFPASTQAGLQGENCWTPIPSYREATDDELMDLERSVAYFSDRRLVYGEWLSSMVTTVTGKCKLLLIEAKDEYNEICLVRGANYLGACEEHQRPAV